MWGYEELIRIVEHPNANLTTHKAEGVYLDADSETLSRNLELEEGADKLKGDRAITASDIIKRNINPSGAITYQPKTDTMIIPLMTFFQCRHWAGTAYGGTRYVGTMIFAPSKTANMDWAGANFGTVRGGTLGTGSDIYTARIEKLLSGAAGTAATNTFVYENAISDAITINANYGEDITIEQSFRALSFHGTKFTLGGAIFTPPSAKGSYSGKTRFVDWQATFTIDGVSYDVQSLRLNLQNQNEARGRLGKYGWAKFPFGKNLHEGEFTLELEDPGLFPPLGTGTLILRCYGGTNDWFQVEMYNCVYRGWDPQASSGESILEVTVPFRCVMDAAKSYSETIVKVAIDRTGFNNISALAG